MARGRRPFRGSEALTKWRKAKQRRTADGGEEEKREEEKKEKEEYAEIKLENAAFEEYYRTQGICPPEEFEAFMASQRLRLPAAVRVNVSTPLWKSTRALLAKMSQEEAGKSVVKELTFFPHKLAYQWDGASKVDMKKDADFREIRRLIISEDFRGVITRQEAVSMLPCLFLDIQPHHLILDMCSSPGSKTSEMLDMLQWKGQLTRLTENRNVVGIQPAEGAVIANDVDLKRAVTLTHQVQRISSPSVAVSCLDDEFAALLQCLYTRVLLLLLLLSSSAAADVPCSGDGTLRKNVDVWRSWNTGGGHSMHAIQLSILYRGLQLLRVGGKIVYSTCSMNPLEDEAVIATVLSQQAGRVEIEKPPHLPGLKWTRGKAVWLVPSPPSRQAEEGVGGEEQKIIFYQSFAQVPEAFRHRIRPTMFPPAGAESMGLENCVRVLPHHNNTGGFFVCCLRKVAELDSSRIFVSNKSKEKTAALARGQQKALPKGHQRRTASCSSDPQQADSPQQSVPPAAAAAPPAAASSCEQAERNPLLDDGGFLSASVGSAAEAAESLYSLAAAASKPGGLFHLLLPVHCDAEGAHTLQLIIEFFGLSAKTPLLPEDPRPPASVGTLPAELLFRRVHSRKKIFLLSKRLAELVTLCYGSGGQHRQWQLDNEGKEEEGGLCQRKTDSAKELRQQVSRILNSKIKWMHAGATVLIRHSESPAAANEFGADGWRIAQEGAALMVSCMRRRVLFVSTEAARFLLLSEERMISSAHLEELEGRKQVLNLSSCQKADGSLEAGGTVCVVCPPSVTHREDGKKKADVSRTAEEEHLSNSFAARFPLANNPCFSSLSDSFSVACMLTRSGNLHAYINKKEARTLASHLFLLPSEQLEEE
ncbi:hypothetical protein Efla_001729 [Eimeria flavescens]